MATPGMRVQPKYPGTEARAGKFPGPSLIPALNAIQARCGWLPREELVALSRDVRRPLYEISGLISFYPHFRTTPPKAVQLAVCHDLACWLHDSDERIAETKARYGDDVEIEIVEVSCLGRCDIAPAAAVDERPIALADADEVVAAARAGEHGEAPALERSGESRPNDPYAVGEERYRVFRRALDGELGSDEIIATLKDSGLRGMGGAGFPTGVKWETVASQEPEPKYTICNADESEPGTFKDRQILAEQPHLVLEGMMLGMLVTGSEEGWVFIRHEYGPEEEVLREEIDALRAQGLLGDDVGGTGRRLQIEIFTSPGGYILGEESALLECMEGHRGEPRNKPPFPALYGLWGKPTLMNSVETFADVPVILERGADWWKDQGINGATGLKFFAISGHVERPGRLLRARGLHDARPHRAGGRRHGRARGRRDPARRRVLELPRPAAPRRAAGLEAAAGGGLDARLRRGDRHGRGHGPARREHERPALLPQRVVRQVRPVPGGLDEGARHPQRPRSQRARAPTTSRRRSSSSRRRCGMTSICGLGQVALGPVLSVLGMDRGGTEARAHPKDREDTET